MSTEPSCALAPLVERHFAGRIDAADERRLREHLPGCERCTRLYSRHLVLAKLDPAAPSTEQRLARGLGLSARRPRAWLPSLGLAGAALAAALVLLAVLRTDDAGFVARGASASGERAQLRVYRLAAGAPAQLVDGVVHAGDELAFAYANPDGRQHLLVFAVDETGQVYWYVPAWTDAASEPRSLAIPAGTDFREIGDAVTHELRGRRLTVHALFTDTSFSVREIESLLAVAPATLARLGRPHLQVELEVRP